MNKTIKVPISIEDNREVEFLFHKYNSLMSIVAYLQENGKMSEQAIDKKIDELVYLNIDLEKKKKICGEKYKPADIGPKYNYTFEFDYCELVYTEINE